ncbi:MAG: type 1 glutamine amidotransferase [Caldimicrobium sp.]|nr:type 1 glutamine amidotransferase [Caldimicrobium sp.]MCX7873022.1 type 1 glutamine amidotransferase [Caldimicrobium sp.]MDW8094837.1 type 1 glutamine amidotransferase domain-containing protein [Caldimicrobium sp.]
MRALIISADGFEDTELLYPLYRLIEEGVPVDIASIKRGNIKGKHGYVVSANLSIEEVVPENYQLLILPGGKAPSILRENPLVLDVVKKFFKENKLIGALCHGPQILVSTGLVANRRMTGYKSIATELKEAGARFEDTEVVIDGNLITSRMPADLPYFMRAIIKALKSAQKEEEL